MQLTEDSLEEIIPQLVSIFKRREEDRIMLLDIFSKEQAENVSP